VTIADTDSIENACMKDKPLNKAVSELCKRLASAGLPTFAKILHRIIADRSITDHERWDIRTRRKSQDRVIEALSEGIHTVPKQGMELPPSEVRHVQELPPVTLESFGDGAGNTELRALEITGVARIERKKILISNPGRIVSGLAALLYDESIWRAFAIQLRVSGLFEEVISPLRVRLRQATSRDQLTKLAYQAGRLYGVEVETVMVDQLLRDAEKFVRGVGAGTAVTISASSGIIDPLERLGTDHLLERLHFPKTSRLAQSLALKSPWREANFTQGLLNPKLNARVLHFFDKEATGDALRANLLLLPGTGGIEYKKLAANLVRAALDNSRFELFAVDSFAPWMWRYSRSGPGHALIVFRHPELRTISEGLALNFRDVKRIHRWFERVFRWSKALPIPPLQLVVMAAAEVESSLFNRVEEGLSHENIEQGLLSVAKRVQLRGKSVKARERACLGFIEELVSASESRHQNQKRMAK
jgi:hypothetical protein